ncbi:MAG TPA: XdhC family protein [Cyclobacteriaceae bacterium]|nr:XdhC family protein [Cyclobacteriaceae bacterium]
MNDVIPLIKQWTKEAKPFAIARVLETWGSSPRQVGSVLVISSEGELAGSVSGGCVEGAVVKEAKTLIGTGGFKVLNYGVTDDDAWSVGLSCGGKIKLLLQDLTNSNSPLNQLLTGETADEHGKIVITTFSGNHLKECVMSGDLVQGDSLPVSIKSKAMELLRARRSQVVEEGDEFYFVHVFPKKSQLLIIGAAHITVDLVSLASSFDFETIVIDPRGAFTNKTQFKTPPDRIFENYPSEVLSEFDLDENTFAVVLSHDPKIDDNALHILLKSGVAYIGALGSRKTHEKRIARLKDAGYSQQEIDRIESPIGVDIHAVGAREIALSIMGSLVRERNAPHAKAQSPQRMN